MTDLRNDIDATGGCCCAGCIGMGPCDLGEDCDDADETIEEVYVDGDYGW